MTARVKDLLEQAAALSTAERAELAALLVEGPDPEDDPRADEEWAREIERRVNELRQGAVQTVPWESVRREALRAL